MYLLTKNFKIWGQPMSVICSANIIVEKKLCTFVVFVLQTRCALWAFLWNSNHKGLYYVWAWFYRTISLSMKVNLEIILRCMYCTIVEGNQNMLNKIKPCRLWHECTHMGKTSINMAEWASSHVGLAWIHTHGQNLNKHGKVSIKPWQAVTCMHASSHERLLAKEQVTISKM